MIVELAPVSGAHQGNLRRNVQGSNSFQREAEKFPWASSEEPVHKPAFTLNQRLSYSDLLENTYKMFLSLVALKYHFLQ